MSTKKEEQLDSLDKQREFFERFFAGGGEYTLYKLYADEGISGKSMRNRKAFLQLLEDAKEGRFDVLFVKDVSRFARNVKDFYHALEVLETSGVRIHFVTMGLRTEQASRFTLGLMALLAEDESERLSAKVKFGKNVTAERGRVPNAVFGYDRVDAFTLVPNPAQAEWVRRVFSLYVEHGMGAARIAQELNAAGVRSARGNIGAWTQSAVCKLLKNRLYTGTVANRKSEVVDFRTGRRRERAPEEWMVKEREAFRIIDEETFERVQSAMAERASGFSARTRHSAEHALSNLVRCALDGRCMRRIAGKGGARWACSVRNARGVDACANASRVDEESIKDALRGIVLCALRSDRRSVERIVQRSERMIALKCPRDGEADRRFLEEKERRYRELYADGLMGRGDLTRSLAALSVQKERARERERAGEQAAAGRAGILRLASLYLEGEREMLDNAFLKRWVQAVEISQDGSARLLMQLGTVVALF